MTDTVSEEKRSEIMSRIRGRDTKPELKVKEVLEESNMDFEYQKEVLGHKVDFFIPPRTVVQVNGCFWHGHKPCYSEPKSNVNYWRQKVITNRKRDSAQVIKLLKNGYRVKPVWECEVDNKLDEIVNFHRYSHTRYLDLSWGELGMFVGFVMGDGSVSYSEYGKRRIYGVHLYNECKDILERYATLIEREGFSVSRRFDGGRENKFGENWKYQISSRFLHLCIRFTKLHSSLLAFPKVDIPLFKLGLIKGFFDAEGGWNSWTGGGRCKPQARFFSERKENLEQVQNLLSDFGIQSRIYPIRTISEYYLSIYQKRSYEKFRQIWEHDIDSGEFKEIIEETLNG